MVKLIFIKLSILAQQLLWQLFLRRLEVLVFILISLIFYIEVYHG